MKKKNLHEIFTHNLHGGGLSKQHRCKTDDISCRELHSCGIISAQINKHKHTEHQAALEYLQHKAGSFLMKESVCVLIFTLLTQPYVIPVLSHHCRGDSDKLITQVTTY